MKCDVRYRSREHRYIYFNIQAEATVCCGFSGYWFSFWMVDLFALPLVYVQGRERERGKKRKIVTTYFSQALLLMFFFLFTFLLVDHIL